MGMKMMGKKCLSVLLTSALCAGSLLPVFAAESDSAAKAANDLLAHYPLQQNAKDISGNGNDGQVKGSVTWTDGLVLPGEVKTSNANASYVTLPEGMFDNQENLTISVWLKSNTNKGNYSALFFGTPLQNNSKMPLNYWLFNPTNPGGLFKSVYTDTNNSGEPYKTEVGVVNGNTENYKGVWTHYTTVLTEGSITGYINGEKVGTASKTKKTADFGSDLQAYIGRSNYVEDNTYGGAFQDLRIYDSSMDDLGVEEVFLNTEEVNDNVKEKMIGVLAERFNISDLLDNGLVGKEGDMGLPTEYKGASVSWSSSDASVISDTGIVTLPTASTNVDLTATLTLGSSIVTKAFTVLVISENGKVEYWKEQLMVPYMLDEKVKLPSSIEDIFITWSGDASVKENGEIEPSFTGKKQAEITATLSDGTSTETKKFPVYIMGTDTVYVESYTRSTGAEYSANLAYSMHLAYSENGAGDFTALNDNSGLLFMRATSGANDVLTAKSMKNPHLFYTEDGKFGVAATRTEIGGGTDAAAKSSVMLYTSEDLRHYEEVGLFSLGTTQTVNNPVCEYDSNGEVYRITWSDGNGTYYQNTIEELAADAQVSDPVIVPEPTVRTVETNIAGAIDGNLIPLENSTGTKLKTKLSKLVNTGMEVPERVSVISKAEVRAVGAEAVYNDGSKANKKVEWDISEVDFLTPGTYTVNGTVTQPTFPETSSLFGARPDPQMAKYNDKFYFISTDENGQSRIFIRESDTLEGIKNSTEKLILSGASYPDLFTVCLWAPELHVVDGELYVFFAGSKTNWAGVQSHVMKLKEGGNPMNAGDWERPKKCLDKNGNNLYEKGITLDMTYFEDADQAYVVWAQRCFDPADNGSWLYIATIDKAEPWKLTSDKVCISKPDYGWGNNSTFVEEGPYMMKKDDNLYLTFSGGGVDNTYCVGILSAKSGDDLLDASTWKKGNYPLLTSNSVSPQYGPGHNAYITDDDGNVYNIFHARWNGGTRSASIRRVHFDIDDEPVLDMIEARDLVDTYKNVTMEVEVTANPNQDAAKIVINLINAIGTVALESKADIDAARDAYEDLNEDQKELLNNYDKLTDAEETLAVLEKEAADKEAADKAAAKIVIDFIDAIGTVTLGSKADIDTARAAYEDLNTDQRELVSNYTKLTNAEKKLAALEKEKTDEAAAKKVRDMIAAIGKVTVNSKDAIANAEKAYNGLSADQKKLVTNYKTLEAAQKAYQNLTKTPKVPAKNSQHTVGKYIYKVTKSGAKNGTVQLVRPKSKKMKKASVLPTVKIKGYTFKVTSVGNKAFRNNKNLNRVTIGENVKTIGKQAFAGCKNLKLIKVNSTKLTTVGNNALKGIKANAKIKVPAKKLSKYKQTFKKKGQKSTVKISK